MNPVRPLLLLSCLVAANAYAQTEVRYDEHLDSHRPEAWALHYVNSTTLMTASGATTLTPGEWNVALDLGHVPRLSAAQQQVGFRGVKYEDLNKSPVFGRVRFGIGLPYGWVAELGYTPPLEMDGVQARDLVSASIGRRVFERGRYSLSARAFGQHGRAEGDITCPAELAGVVDPDVNPYRCQAPSSDRVKLAYYGIDLTSAWAAPPWQWHATLGAVRSEPEVQVNALVFDVRDRSRLTTRDVLPHITIGGNRMLGPDWQVGLELLHVPLHVDRGSGLENDPMTSVRMHLTWFAR